MSAASNSTGPNRLTAATFQLVWNIMSSAVVDDYLPILTLVRSVRFTTASVLRAIEHC